MRPMFPTCSVTPLSPNVDTVSSLPTPISQPLAPASVSLVAPVANLPNPPAKKPIPAPNSAASPTPRPRGLFAAAFRIVWEVAPDRAPAAPPARIATPYCATVVAVAPSCKEPERLALPIAPSPPEAPVMRPLNVPVVVPIPQFVQYLP